MARRQAALTLIRHIVASPTGRIHVWIAVHEAGEPHLFTRQLSDGAFSPEGIISLLPDILQRDPRLHRRAVWILRAVYGADITTDVTTRPVPPTPRGAQDIRTRTAPGRTDGAT